MKQNNIPVILNQMYSGPAMCRMMMVDLPYKTPYQSAAGQACCIAYLTRNQKLKVPRNLPFKRRNCLVWIRINKRTGIAGRFTFKHGKDHRHR
jgi:hypothetical protein